MRLTFDKSVPITEQRLRVAMSKSKRNHGKRHGTGKRTAAEKSKAKAVQAFKIATWRKRTERWKALARAYWRGESDVHP